MIAHFGKDWGMKKTSFKSWARFFKLYSAFFDICYKDEEKHTERTTKKRSFKNIKIKSRIPKLKPLEILDLFLGNSRFLLALVGFAPLLANFIRAAL